MNAAATEKSGLISLRPIGVIRIGFAAAAGTPIQPVYGRGRSEGELSRPG